LFSAAAPESDEMTLLVQALFESINAGIMGAGPLYNGQVVNGAFVRAIPPRVTGGKKQEPFGVHGIKISLFGVPGAAPAAPAQRLLRNEAMIPGDVSVFERDLPLCHDPPTCLPAWALPIWQTHMAHRAVCGEIEQVLDGQLAAFFAPSVCDEQGIAQPGFVPNVGDLGRPPRLPRVVMRDAPLRRVAPPVGRLGYRDVFGRLIGRSFVVPSKRIYGTCIVLSNLTVVMNPEDTVQRARFCSPEYDAHMKSEARVLHLAWHLALYEEGWSPAHCREHRDFTHIAKALPDRCRRFVLPMDCSEGAYPFGGWECFESLALLGFEPTDSYGGFDAPDSLTWDDTRISTVKITDRAQRRCADAITRYVLQLGGTVDVSPTPPIAAVAIPVTGARGGGRVYAPCAFPCSVIDSRGRAGVPTRLSSANAMLHAIKSGNGPKDCLKIAGY